MKPTLPRPTLEQSRSMVALLKSPAWQGFGDWLEDCEEGAIKRLMTCDEEDLVGARAMAAALHGIIDVLQTAPDAVRETDTP